MRNHSKFDCLPDSTFRLNWSLEVGNLPIYTDLYSRVSSLYCYRLYVNSSGISYRFLHGTCTNVPL